VVADDDADIRDLVRRKLDRHEIDTVPVHDGRSALAAVAQHRPDLVLLDVMMPGMSGLEVCAAIRAAVETVTLPVILLTAGAREADAINGIAAGADDFVVKPFSPAELVRRVQARLAVVPR
jgi:DNA-binding response OmpR family regulator